MIIKADFLKIDFRTEPPTVYIFNKKRVKMAQIEAEHVEVIMEVGLPEVPKKRESGC